MATTTTKLIGELLIVLAIFSGVILSWQFGKDWVKLNKEGSTIAKEKWVVSAERTYFVLSSWYDKNVKCPKVIKLGGHISSSGTRCYYPDNYYESMSRSLVNTDISSTEDSKGTTVLKKSPFYQYGTTGSYAGHVTENFFFSNPTLNEPEFPQAYNVEWSPKDTRNYKLEWRIEGLKQINLPDGEYTDCHYEFGDILIDFCKDASKVDKVLISQGSRMTVHFKPSRGDQSFNPSLVVPFYYPDNVSVVSLKLVTEYNNWTTYAEQWLVNETCIWNATNSSWSPCSYNVSVETNHSEIVKQWQELNINNASRNMSDWSVWCWDNGVDLITCKSTLDGDGEFKQETISAGMSYFWINYTIPPVVFYTDDHYGDYYLQQLEAMVNE